MPMIVDERKIARICDEFIKLGEKPSEFQKLFTEITGNLPALNFENDSVEKGATTLFQRAVSIVKTFFTTDKLSTTAKTGILASLILFSVSPTVRLIAPLIMGPVIGGLVLACLAAVKLGNLFLDLPKRNDHAIPRASDLAKPAKEAKKSEEVKTHPASTDWADEFNQISNAADAQKWVEEFNQVETQKETAATLVEEFKQFVNQNEAPKVVPTIPRIAGERALRILSHLAPDTKEVRAQQVFAARKNPRNKIPTILAAL